ncbi:MAG TPA: hypothetical protein VM144_12740 [Aestuariivirga sp.]|nr:hypothetical protein [Aestuariivirga sp.]
MNHPLSKNELSAASNDAANNDSESPESTPVPSWLTQHYGDDDAELLVNQYRRKQEEEPAASPPPENRTYEYYRRRIMERQREQLDLQMDRAPMPRVPSRPTISASELEVQHRRYDRERDEAPVSYSSTYERPRLKKSLLFAGVFAAVAGGAVGFAVTKYDHISNSANGLYAFAAGFLPSDSETMFNSTGQTTISKKPIAIASLAVSDVTGTLNSMIPLALNAEPAFENQELAIKITGLPASAYLTAGKKIADNTWILKDGEEDGINLFVPQSDTAKFDISVAAIETNTGELAAPVKEMTVAIDDVKIENETALQITPVSAPPETVIPVKSTQQETIVSAAPAQETIVSAVPAIAAAALATESFQPIKPALSAEVTGLLGKGDMLMKTGDLIIARQFYSRAFQMGAAEGAMGVARTYDPAVFAEMKVQGITPDAAKAAEWYEKAKQAGVTEAQAALTTLSAAAQP